MPDFVSFAQVLQHLVRPAVRSIMQAIQHSKNVEQTPHDKTFMLSLLYLMQHSLAEHGRFAPAEGLSVII